MACQIEYLRLSITIANFSFMKSIGFTKDVENPNH